VFVEHRTVVSSTEDCTNCESYEIDDIPCVCDRLTHSIVKIMAEVSFKEYPDERENHDKEKGETWVFE